jgi:hypothetical protein
MLLYLTPVHDRGHGRRRITAVLQRHKEEEEEAEARSRLAGVYPCSFFYSTYGNQRHTIEKPVCLSRILGSLSTTDLTETRFLKQTNPYAVND